MLLSLHHFRRPDFRALVAWMVLAACLLRAFVPVGYMPDLQALQQGLFKITICTSQGSGKLVVGEDGQPVSGEHKGKETEVCSYALNGVAALTVPEAPQLYSALFFLLIHDHLPVLTVMDDRSFGNASPRSPPGV